MDDLQKTLIEKYQCPGCCSGVDTSSGCFKQDPHNLSCKNHGAGGILFPIGAIHLGLPKGFNRLGPVDQSRQGSNIRIQADFPSNYGPFNIPVWALEHEGDLIVHCVCPRLNENWIDIIPGKKISDLPEPYCNTVVDVAQLDLSQCA